MLNGHVLRAGRILIKKAVGRAARTGEAENRVVHRELEGRAGSQRARNPRVRDVRHGQYAGRCDQRVAGLVIAGMGQNDGAAAAVVLEAVRTGDFGQNRERFTCGRLVVGEIFACIHAETQRAVASDNRILVSAQRQSPRIFQAQMRTRRKGQRHAGIAEINRFDSLVLIDQDGSRRTGRENRDIGIACRRGAVLPVQRIRPEGIAALPRPRPVSAVRAPECRRHPSCTGPRL